MLKLFTALLLFALLSPLANGNVEDWQPQQVHLSLGGNMENSVFIWCSLNLCSNLELLSHLG